MSLRLRLVIIIGLALTVLWAAAAAWLWRDVSRDLQGMLDDRLAMSANMVAGLLDRQLTFADGSGSVPGAATLVTVPAQQGMACQIRSMRGEVIAATHSAPATLSDQATPGYHVRMIDGTAWRTFTLQTGGMSITTADRMAGRDKLRQRIALTAGVPFLIAVVGGLAALWFGTGRGLAPLRRLRRALSRRGPDALEPLPATGLPLELRPLVSTLNHLLDRTDQAMQRERHFTNDAAHELRTPLTAISTHLQVARMTEGAASATALADAEAGVARMQSTLEQLLLLARLEGHVSFDEADGIDAATALDRAMADAVPQARQRIVIHDENGGMPLAVPPALAVVALRNLVDNALQHARGNSPVAVHIESADGAVRFRIIDAGPGLAAATAAQATRRFWRDGAGHGSGLGLTIVAAVARRYDGGLQLINRTPGLEARLELPCA